jgi:PPK2 family polyphosphate:nucleotide phosphotransferase
VLLQPIAPGAAPSLDDEEAAAPRSLPPRKELRARTRELRGRMDELQRRLYAEGRQALLVVLQARDAGGKDGLIRRVFGGLNPQGCTVTSFGPPSARELRQDFLWRVHAAVPPVGTIGIFNRSHYEDVLVVRVRNLVPRESWSKRYEQIVSFERILHENRVTVLKFMLHVSRDEQARRLMRRLDDPRRNWKFDPGDIDDRARWDEYTEAYRDALARTSLADAPWFVIPADDKRVRDYLAAELVVEALERMSPEFPQANEENVRSYIDSLKAVDRGS